MVAQSYLSLYHNEPPRDMFREICICCFRDGVFRKITKSSPIPLILENLLGIYLPHSEILADTVKLLSTQSLCMPGSREEGGERSRLRCFGKRAGFGSVDKMVCNPKTVGFR